MGNMPEWLKVTFALAALLGGTNGAQYFGITRPARVEASGAEAVQSSCQQDLLDCYDALKECHGVKRR